MINMKMVLIDMKVAYQAYCQYVIALSTELFR